MTNRWSTLRIDEASVMHLGVIDTLQVAMPMP